MSAVATSDCHLGWLISVRTHGRSSCYLCCARNTYSDVPSVWSTLVAVLLLRCMLGILWIPNVRSFIGAHTANVAPIMFHSVLPDIQYREPVKNA